MVISRVKGSVILALLLILLGPFQRTASSAAALQGAKVLVVMSYSRQNISEVDIRAGIEEVLGESKLKYFYMNTKKRPQDGAVMAKKAYEVYKSFLPEVIIVADDNAQSEFVVPYISRKVNTPVVFCGVNNSAKKYNYPAAQVTGILEKKHYLQTINFAKLINPQLDSVAVIYKDNVSNQANLAQIRAEQGRYGVNIVAEIAVANHQELEAIMVSLEEKADGLFVLNLSGILDQNGKKMNRNESIQVVNNGWSKITMGASKSEVEGGLLCAVAKVNTEQGVVAAQMAVKIIEGTPVIDIPITENRNGQRIVNITTAKNIGIKLKSIALLGTQLVR